MRSAFTLIELLVVITIIVVLLALLAPALDRAVYQAQLVVCGANLRGLGGGAQAYTADHKRRYPYRKAILVGGGINNVLSHGSGPAVTNIGLDEADDRIRFRPYIKLNAYLLCPIAPQIDLETTQSDLIYSHYSLWLGMKYTGQATGMLKMGDRLTLSQEFNHDNGKSIHAHRTPCGDHDHRRALGAAHAGAGQGDVPGGAGGVRGAAQEHGDGGDGVCRGP